MYERREGVCEEERKEKREIRISMKLLLYLKVFIDISNIKTKISYRFYLNVRLNNQA